MSRITYSGNNATIAKICDILNSIEGGGSDVTITTNQSTGNKICTITVNDTGYDLYTGEVGSEGLTSTTSTLLAENWENDTPPYVYDLGVEYSNKNSIISVDTTNLSLADFEKIGKFCIVGRQSGRYLYAMQWHPNIDIPVIIDY